MLNVLIAIVSDSYDAVIIRSKQLFLRAKFQVVADMMLMFPNTIQSEDSFKYIGSSLTDKVLSFICQPYGMYPVVKHFWCFEWGVISGEYNYDNAMNNAMNRDEIPSWKCWLARIILILRIIFLIPFWTLHLFSLLIDRFNFMMIF